MLPDAKLWYQEFRHCPCCGTTYQSANFNPQAVLFTCASCGYEFFQNSIPSVSVAIPKAGAANEVLLIRRATEPAIDKLALPGGITGFGESPVEAIIRETREETSIAITVAGILTAHIVDYVYKGRLHKMLEIAFEATPYGGSLQGIHTPEARELGFFPIDQILADRSRLAFPEQSRVLEQYAYKISTFTGARS